MAVYFVDQCSFFANGSRMGIEFTISLVKGINYNNALNSMNKCKESI